MSNNKFDLNTRNNRQGKMNKFGYDDEGEYNFNDYKKDRQRKKMKRVNAALKSKNIDKLIEYEEDFE